MEVVENIEQLFKLKTSSATACAVSAFQLLRVRRESKNIKTNLFISGFLPGQKLSVDTKREISLKLSNEITCTKCVQILLLTTEERKFFRKLKECLTCSSFTILRCRGSQVQPFGLPASTQSMIV